MSVVGDVLDQLAQGPMTRVAAVAFPYVMDITTEEESEDLAGDELESTSTVTYEGIPVSLKLQGNTTGRNPGEPLTVNNRYMMTFPVIHQGERITINQKTDLLIVQPRGMEPERRFKIEVPRNPDGVFYKVIGVEQGTPEEEAAEPIEE